MALAKPVDALMEEADPESIEGMRSHLDFHLTIARYSGFSILEEELRRVWLKRLMVLNWVSATVNRPPPDWHQQLVNALAKRDPDHAEQVMRHHVQGPLS